MIETIEAGAGSYPEPHESKYKSYEIKFAGTIEAITNIYASSNDEAKELFYKNGFEEYDIESMEIEDILNVKEE